MREEMRRDVAAHSHLRPWRGSVGLLYFYPVAAILVSAYLTSDDNHGIMAAYSQLTLGRPSWSGPSLVCLCSVTIRRDR